MVNTPKFDSGQVGIHRLYWSVISAQQEPAVYELNQTSQPKVLFKYYLAMISYKHKANDF